MRFLNIKVTEDYITVQDIHIELNYNFSFKVLFNNNPQKWAVTTPKNNEQQPLHEEKRLIKFYRTV